METVRDNYEDTPPDLTTLGRRYNIVPILVICLPNLSVESRAAIQEAANANEKIKNSGWIFLILNGFKKASVSAFGVPESELETFEELKKLLEDQIKQNGK